MSKNILNFCTKSLKLFNYYYTYRKLCELLMIRDTTLIPNVLWFEYTKSRQEARARGRKMASLKTAQ